MKVVEKDKKIPIPEERIPDKLLENRSSEMVFLMDALLQKSKDSKNLVHGTGNISDVEQPANINQKVFDEMVFLADIEPFTGLRDDEKESLKEEFSNWKSAGFASPEQVGEQSNTGRARMKRKAWANRQPIVNDMGIGHLTQCLVKQFEHTGIPLKDVSDTEGVM